MNRKSWYEQKKRPFFIFLCCCLIFIFIAKDVNIGSASNSENIVYTVYFDFFGTDAKTMERLITIPMEELISSIDGLKETQSVSDYGQAIITAYFHPKVNKKNVYLNFRDAVDTLYVKLPSSVQKPRIYSSEANQNTTIRIAILENSVTKIKTYIEQEIKPVLEGIKGVSEVKISGGKQEEILVKFDNEKLTSKGINPTSFGSIIQEANFVSSGAKIRSENKKQNLIFDTKIKSLADIRILPISAEKVMQLSDYAIVCKDFREQTEYVRVNGKECITIDVKTSFDGKAIFVSKKCLEKISQTELKNCDYKILYDKGKEQKKLLLSVVFAIIQGLVIILFIVPLFFGYNETFLVGILIPVCVLWSIAQIKLLGLNLDVNILSGIGLAIGLIADIPFVIAEQNKKDLKQIFPSVIASCFTTILCLVPLCFLDSINPGIKDISISIILMLINSTIISMVFFPCFLSDSKSPNKAEKYYLKPIYFSCIFFLKHQKKTIIFFVILSLLPFIIFSFIGNSVSNIENPNLLSFYLEYESGTTSKKIDKDCIDLAEKISNIEGIDFILSNAQKGRAEFEIGFNSKKINYNQLVKKIQQYNFPEAFLYIANLDSSKNKKIHRIEVAVTGDDSEECKKYAYEAIKLCSRKTNIIQYVLNFKESENIVSVKPNNEKLIKYNFTVNDLANSLRQIIFGPVVDKWIQDGKELDIRTIGLNKNQIALSDIQNIVLSSPNGNFLLGSVGNIELISDTGKLYRKDNRSAAYFTLHVKANNINQALIYTQKLLSSLKLEKGYSFRFQRQIEDVKNKYNIFAGVLILCSIAVYLLLLALMENPIKALVTTAVIFASMSFPLIFNAIQFKALDSGHIVGLVILCGLSVNTAIFIEQSSKMNSLRKVRDKIQSILLTNLSTILGCLPLLAVQNIFTKNLAQTLIIGTIGSFVIGTFLYPVILEKINQKF